MTATISKHPTGKVIFVGAGPGDPELLTLKAVRHLAVADVVLQDRLVNDSLVRQHAPNAQVIYVGKQHHHNQSTPQQTINQLLVHYALQGKYVVRLKGGDISIFSNILDELEALQENKISFELVPGITAALGAAAYASVPLTARGFSKGVRFLTYYSEDAIPPADWQNLATTTDTLVFYMSGSSCFQLAETLVRYGKKSTTGILLAEQATTALQQYHASTLENCSKDWASHNILSPALLMVGEVVELHRRFSCLLNGASSQAFFASPQGIASMPTASQSK